MNYELDLCMFENVLLIFIAFDPLVWYARRSRIMARCGDLIVSVPTFAFNTVWLIIMDLWILGLFNLNIYIISKPRTVIDVNPTFSALIPWVWVYLLKLSKSHKIPFGTRILKMLFTEFPQIQN